MSAWLYDCAISHALYEGFGLDARDSSRSWAMMNFESYQISRIVFC